MILTKVFTYKLSSKFASLNFADLLTGVSVEDHGEKSI